VASQASTEEAPAGELIVHLDAPLPESLAIGAGTAVFVSGTCFCPSKRIRSLQLVVDGDLQSLMAHGMPRLDVFRMQHPELDPFDTGGIERDADSPDDPQFHSYSSGFWGIARVAPRHVGEDCELRLRAQLDGGGEMEAELGRLPTTAVATPAVVEEPDPSGGALVAICMATYDPAPEMFLRQVDSIRAQTHRNWVCVISDDCSRPERFAAMKDAVERDPRFVVSRSPRRLGFYRNFERALGMAPTGARYVAMADQDDSWHPDKLETLLGALGNARLVYSDARLVDPGGHVVSNTYWTHRRNNHWSMASLLMANCVTGAASLFRRDVLDTALPFPPPQFAHFHDHWVGLTALALGDIAFVERPLYDYVQHGDAVIGHAAANGLLTAPSRRQGRVERLRQNPQERVARWRMTFFVANCRLTQFAAVLQMRCAARMERSKRRSIDRFLRADRSLVGLPWLWLRGRRELSGRTETLGAEMGLLAGFLWRRLLAASARGRRRPSRRLRMDALPPSNLAPGPRMRQPAGPATRVLAERTAPLDFATGDDVPQRVNLLVSAVAPDDPHGDQTARLQIARRLTERGHRVRIVTCEPAGPLPRSWRRGMESSAGLEGLLDGVEVAFGREAQRVEVSRSDAFMATDWQTAHVAHAAVQGLGAPRFAYLVEDYAPFRFPMGSRAALATESYGFPHFALFSTELLRDYFRRHAIGVYSRDGDNESAMFQPVVPGAAPLRAQDLAGHQTRGLVVHARPEAHASHEMFDLAVLGLDRALAAGAFGGWRIYGAGLAGPGRVAVGGGTYMEPLPPSGGTGIDVGLALHHTPHPGLAQIEMAAAGMLTVTSAFENKTPEAMAEVSTNLITVQPTLEGIAAGLLEAAAGVDDLERRASGSRVNWSRDWNDSLPNALIDRLVASLEA